MTKTSGYEPDAADLIHPDSEESRDTTLLTQAQTARGELFDDPAGTLPTVEGLLARVQTAGDQHALAVLLAAMAWAARELLDHDTAISHADRAVTAGQQCGVPAALANALTVRAMVNLELGRADLVTADLAAAHDLGAVDADLRFATAVVADATGDLRTSMPILQALADDDAAPTLIRAKALINLGDSLARDEPAAALDLLRRAGDLVAGESDYLGVVVEHNRGVALAHAGRLGEAMRSFDRAGRRLAELGGPAPEHQHEVARVLGDLWLLSEARAAVTTALAGLDGDGGAMVRADVLTTAGRLAADDGETESARAYFSESGRLFAEQGRRRGQCLADLELGRLMLTAEPEDIEQVDALAGRLVAAAAELEHLGFEVDAADARLLAGRLLHRLDGERARPLWETVTASPAAEGLLGREAALRLAILSGDPTSAQKIATDALHLLDQRSALAGSVDLRHRLSRTRVRFEQLSRTALLQRPAEEQLDALLRQRPPASRVADDTTDPQTQHWRLIWRQLAHRLNSDEESPETLAALRRQFAEAERNLRMASWSARGAHGSDPSGVAELRRSGTAVAALARIGRRAIGFAMSAEDPRAPVASVDLGSWADLIGELAQVERGLSRMVSAPAAAAGRARAGTRELLARLDLRLAPLLSAASARGRQLHLIVERGLEGACWAGVPSLWSRPFTVSSLAVTRAPTGPSPAAKVLLAHGPGLVQAEGEVAALQAIWPEVCGVASAAAVRAELPGSRIVHLAAHTRLRWDNPLASAAQFADGPLSLEEILETGAQPDLLYLSGCSLANSSLARLAAQQGGAELVGPLPLLAEHGIAEVVASVIALIDEEAPDIAATVHRHLQAGSSASAGLAEARARCDPGDPDASGRWACLAALSVVSALP